MSGSRQNSSQIIEEKISIQKYGSCEALKEKIRRHITSYRESGWTLIDLSVRGAFIYLKFKYET
jgi:hypothetical protein